MSDEEKLLEKNNFKCFSWKSADLKLNFFEVFTWTKLLVELFSELDFSLVKYTLNIKFPDATHVRTAFVLFAIFLKLQIIESIEINLSKIKKVYSF